MLEHVSEPRQFLQGIVNILSPNGSLILAVPNPESYLNELDHLLLDMPPHHSTRWSSNTFEFVSRKFNLELVGIANEPLRYVHYQLYLSNLTTKFHSHDLGAARSFRQRLRRFLGTILSRNIERVASIHGYQQHKKVLAGQTHLAEFRKL